MFTTFPGTTSRRSRDAGHKDGTPESRPKRSQVHRACDWCKLLRIKCDNHRPCHSCVQGGRDCVTNGHNQFRSIVAAAKEVERLRTQVREFESSMKQPKSPTAAAGPRRPSLSNAYTDRSSASRNGVLVNSVLYGVSSLPCFLKRMSSFFESTLHRPPLDIAAICGAANVPPPSLRGDGRAGILTRAQEEHFLDLFWRTHYFSFPIVNEAKFRSDYQALWAGRAPDGERQASALVDIVLALCIQIGTKLIQHGGETKEPERYTSAGFEYYQRAQALIKGAIETPSVEMVQCYVFSIVYLSEAGLLNRAQVMAGEAIVLAAMLGLPQEPQVSETEPQKEMSRRTWWSLYILDAQLSIEVGRPPMIDPEHSTCHLPSDAPEMAQLLGPHYMFDDSCVTWLGFQNHTLRLVDTVRTVSSAFHAKFDAVLGQASVRDFYSNGTAREECARFLSEQMKELSAWADQVPQAYRVPRQGGKPFSTDRFPLDLGDDSVPIHCQRQRLLLELQYHHYALILCRPFICFVLTPDMPTPVADSRAAASLHHAMTLTNMIHQALVATEALGGMNHVFWLQKGALFTMLGHAYTFPVSHSTAATRRAIATAIAVADMYRDVLPEAALVAALARTLAAGVESIISGLRAGGSGSSAAPVPAAAQIMSEDGVVAADGGAATALEDQPGSGGGPLAAADHESLDLRFLDKLGEDWGDMDALWASLEEHNRAEDDEAWMLLPFGEAGAEVEAPE